MLLSRSGRRLGPDGAAALLRKVATSALGAERARRVHLHSTRHLYGLACASAGVSPIALAQALGHTSVQHVLRYTSGAALLAGAHPSTRLARLLEDQEHDRERALR
jgi:integrase